MYTVRITTRSPISPKQKEILLQAVKEADGDAECKIGGSTCEFSGKGNDFERLSYLFGIMIGGSLPNGIDKLSLSYEKRDFLL